MSNSLSAVHPELVAEWSDRNLPLTPDSITFGSNKKVWWKGACGHEWETSVKARSNGEKCPICSGARVVTGINDLSTLKPELASEWSEKNKIKPTEVSIGSHKKVIWKCKLGHKWIATVKSRTINKTGCPYCSHNKVLVGFNDLATLFPEVADEWSDRNENSPTDVKPFLLYRVEKEPTMERRKDKNNHVLKDGESYREKEHRYMYRWVDSDKKRHCTYAQTLRELRKKEAEINRNKSDGISSAGSNLRLDDVYNLWKKNKVGLKQSTYVNYLYMYEHFIGPKIGKMKIKDIRKSTVLGLYNDLTRSNDIGKTMAINTLEVIHNVLRQVLQVAVDDDYIRKNPTEGVLREVKKANNYERPKRKALTLEQQNAFIRFLKSKPLYYSWSILFAVLLGTGCRIAEFIGLRWCDIDWKNNTISINHNLVYRQHTDGKCYFSVTTPKTSAGCRTIPMMKDVRRALEDEKIRQQELGVRCTTVIDGYTDFAFFNRFGQPHNPAAINREIDRLVLAYNAQEMEKAAEENRTPVILPDFSCHQLRHTFCTRYCEIEPNIKVIQEVMGHKDIKTTMEIYAEAQKELKERSVQNISGKFDVY